jgi:hypothetical protein
MTIIRMMKWQQTHAVAFNHYAESRTLRTTREKSATIVLKSKERVMRTSKQHGAPSRALSAFAR